MREKNKVTIDECHEYWQAPDDGRNRPENYLSGNGKSAFLAGFVKLYVPHNKTASIIELGCNVGRNLAYLRQEYYKNLAGIDISAEAIRVGIEKHPELFGVTACEDILSFLKRQESKEFVTQWDLVFTMAVLEHLHDREFGDVCTLIPKIIKPDGFLMTIESEYASTSWRKFSGRPYREIFTALGLHHLLKADASPAHSELEGYWLNVFIKEHNVCTTPVTCI